MGVEEEVDEEDMGFDDGRPRTRVEADARARTLNTGLHVLVRAFK
jgi:hypothetical protein